MPLTTFFEQTWQITGSLGSKLARVLLLACLCWLEISSLSTETFAKEQVNYSNAEMSGKIFRYEDLQGGNFVSANLRGSDFQKANLMGATLSKCNLAGANLQGANLSAALLDLANLEHANLKNANLSGVIASRADWFEVEITGADFSDAILDRSAIIYLCQRAEGSHPETGLTTRETLGCR
ncbi:MAG: pentapeptide repeat-containing protein [Cyanobacteriota bacterium]|nr:pentapeptide repeat-containing protein [Cyanobacteriota bacterium]